jgi:hypothetical protein
VDAAYQARYLETARLLWEASQGDPGSIPQDYCEHLAHSYADGDVSLVPLLNRVEDYSELDDFEIEEAIEILGKVNPSDWPDAEDVKGVSMKGLLELNEENDDSLNFVEDNLGTAEKVEQVLTEVISSVFGDRVSNIRSEKNFYANPKNKFLQQEDGTFGGTFMYDGKRFIFEVAPSESGWLCTYRLHHKDLDKLPPVQDEDTTDVNDYTRRLRHRSWK